MLCVVDEFAREALAIKVARRFDSNHVVEVLADLCVVRGVPEHIRSDQGSEFIAKAVKDWVRRLPTSRRAAPGRTAMWRASTASSGTSCQPMP
jgi:transposase InsO family protein